MKAKLVLGILIGSFLFVGCNMNPSKEARIQKLETEVKQSMETINQLEMRIEKLEEIKVK